MGGGAAPQLQDFLRLGVRSSCGPHAMRALLNTDARRAASAAEPPSTGEVGPTGRLSRAQRVTMNSTADLFQVPRIRPLHRDLRPYRDALPISASRSISTCQTLALAGESNDRFGRRQKGSWILHLPLCDRPVRQPITSSRSHTDRNCLGGLSSCVRFSSSTGFLLTLLVSCTLRVLLFAVFLPVFCCACFLNSFIQL
eukprot:SAG31_NODE_14_length_37953_cov_109.719660_18_plen_198_part_00